MPGKSGHAKGKHLSRSKRRKGSQKIQFERQDSPAITTPQQPIAQADEPAPALTTSAPSASIPTPVTKLPAIQYPYIGIELRRIGILAGTMLVILVVLSLVDLF